MAPYRTDKEMNEKKWARTRRENREWDERHRERLAREESERQRLAEEQRLHREHIKKVQEKRKPWITPEDEP